MVETGEITTHGVGFAFAQWLRKRFVFSDWQNGENRIQCEGSIEDLSVTLVVNLTSVNKAGEALNGLNTSEGILLVHDDIEIAYGKTRLVLRNAGDGGHKGVKSILQALGGTELMRLKIGLKNFRGITGIEKLLDAPITTDDLEEIFVHGFDSLRSSLLVPLARQQLASSKLVRVGQYATELCQSHAAQMAQVLESLNIPQRTIKSIAPPTFAVLPVAKANKLIEAAMTLTEATMLAYKFYREAIALPGVHENVTLLRQFVPERIWTTGDAQKGIVPQYLNWDFHDGNGVTEVSLIEGNMYMGGPDESFLLEEWLLANNLVPDGASTMNAPLIQSGEPIGIQALADYVIKPFVTKPSDLIAIVTSSGSRTTQDAHTYILADLLQQQGFNAQVCDSSELQLDDPNKPTKLMLGGKCVRVVWARMTISETLRTAVIKGLVTLLPFQGFKQFTRKSGLVNFSDPAIRLALGIGHLGNRLETIVPFSTYVTPQNVGLLQMMRRNQQFAVKYVLGGGGRNSFIVGPTGQNSAYILNEAARSFGTKSAIMQELAPRFDMPGTNYEFDVRVLIYTAQPYKSPEYKLHWLARVYEKGGDKPLGFTPILVV